VSGEKFLLTITTNGHLRTAQKLMRHSNVNLTANIYTETLPSELRDAAEKLA